jgi:hypothetical protein
MNTGIAVVLSSAPLYKSGGTPTHSKALRANALPTGCALRCRNGGRQFSLEKARAEARSAAPARQLVTNQY